MTTDADDRGLTVASPLAISAVELDPYTARALAEIHAWKCPPETLTRRAARLAAKPVDVAGGVMMATPVVGWVIEKSAAGLVDLLNDAVSKTVRVEAILAELRSTGPGELHDLQDVADLSLEQVDRAIGYLAAKYKSLAAAEGGLAGAIGAPGIPADLVALVALNLRAIAEYAVYCGFDPRLQSERIFALRVLELASGPSQSAKSAAITHLARVAADVARKESWQQLERHAFVALVRKLSERLGVQLTKAKLAQAVPVAGAAVGGGFNAYYTARVCNAAFYLYRERFIARRYGVGVVEGG